MMYKNKLTQMPGICIYVGSYFNNFTRKYIPKSTNIILSYLPIDFLSKVY